LASLLTGVCPQCFYAHRRATAPYVKNCNSFGILAPWAVDCKCRKKFLQFFILNAVQSISEAYKIQLQRLIEADKESQTKTQATLQRLKELIKTVERIEFED
jgi:hypothetical protein